MDRRYTPARRQTAAVALTGAVAVAAVIGWGTGGLTAAQQLQKLLSGLDPNKPVSLVANGVEKSLGATSSTGDLSLAADLATAIDPNKSFVVYKRDCSKYEIVAKDSAEDRKCKDDQKQNPQAPNGCGSCVPVGIIVGGRFTASASQAGSGGSHTGRNVGIGAAVAGGIAGAAIAAKSGSSSPATTTAVSPAPQTSFTLSNTAVRVTGTVAQSGCPLFGNYTGTGTLTVNTSGSGTFVVADPGGANRTYQISGTFASGGTSLAFNSAAFNWASGTGRNYASQLSTGTMSTNGTGTATETHTYLSGGSAGPTPNCADRITLSFAP